MGGVFGRHKGGPGGDPRGSPSRITEQDQAILKLKKQRDELKKYQKRINGVMEKDRLMAKRLLQENKKDRALLLLKKKKFQEGLLIKTDQQLETLERLVHDLEYSQVQKRVLDGLKEGNEALKKANDMFSIEEIEAIMEDTAEAAEKQREITVLISGNLTSEDEDEVLRELDRLVNEDEVEEVQLPDVPEDALPGQFVTSSKEVNYSDFRIYRKVRDQSFFPLNPGIR